MPATGLLLFKLRERSHYSLRFFILWRRRTLIVLTPWPEGQAKSNQKYSAQKQEECGLLEPGYGRHSESHGDTQKADLKRRKIEPGEKGAESQQHQKHETGCWRREQLLHA